ncbi:hypothetical protein DFH29DRAFT_875938 [Suillus ampliporus]|nr:hypothetical protein DFH29DRAFT_875938 [Suillus ampliporus]
MRASERATGYEKVEKAPENVGRCGRVRDDPGGRIVCKATERTRQRIAPSTSSARMEMALERFSRPPDKKDASDASMVSHLLYQYLKLELRHIRTSLVTHLSAVRALIRIVLLLQELSVPNIVELKFSPRGTYLSTWERPVELEDSAQHKNLRAFSASTGEELIWDLQCTIFESHVIRLVSQEIQVCRPVEWGKGIADKLRVEDTSMVSLSYGLSPSIAVFVAGKEGAPAIIKIYGLSTLSGAPTCSKTFYKAGRAQIRRNDLSWSV